MIKFRHIVISSVLITAALYTYCIGSGLKFNIYSVKYGESMFSNRFVFYNDKSGAASKFSWMFYFIEYGEKKILIDTGFNNQKSVNIFGISNFKDPVIILNENGISPDAITDVIITHSHFDHIGNVHKFRNARIIIQSEEFAALNRDKQLADVRKFLKGNSRVTVFNDSIMLYDKFMVKKIGGHTKGSSVVFFEDGGEKYCFTGDEVYLTDNVEKNTGNGSVVDHKRNVDFINLIKKGYYKLFIFHDNRYLNSPDRVIRVFP